MKQHALVLGAQSQKIAYLFGSVPLDVAQRDDQPLALGQLGQSRSEMLARLKGQQPPLGLLPRPRRRGPMSRPGVIVALEAVGVDCSSALILGRERRERRRP